MKRTSPAANPIAAFSDLWVDAWTRPFSAWQGWNSFWGEQWHAWLSAFGSGPSPWLPALAEGRENQPSQIDFFLPWLPRLDGGASADGHDSEEAVKVMLRAALPWAPAADWLMVEARAAGFGIPLPARQPAEKAAPKAAAPAVRTVEALPVAVAKPAAAKKALTASVDEMR